MRKIFLIIFFGSLIFPLISSAGTYQADGQTITFHGFVPCGKSQAGPGESSEVTNPCQLCHIFVLFDEVLRFIFFTIVPPLAILMIAIAGFMYMFAGGSPSTLGRAKSILTSTAIALIIIYGAWVIVNLIFLIIGVNDWTGLKGGWFSINCPIKFQ